MELSERFAASKADAYLGARGIDNLRNNRLSASGKERHRAQGGSARGHLERPKVASSRAFCFGVVIGRPVAFGHDLREFLPADLWTRSGRVVTESRRGFADGAGLNCCDSGILESFYPENYCRENPPEEAFVSLPRTGHGSVEGAIATAVVCKAVGQSFRGGKVTTSRLDQCAFLVDETAGTYKRVDVVPEAKVPNNIENEERADRAARTCGREKRVRVRRS